MRTTTTAAKNEGKRIIKFSIRPLEVLKPRLELPNEIKKMIHKIVTPKKPKVKKPLFYIHLSNTCKPFLPEDAAIELREMFSKLLEPKQHPAI